MNAKTEGLTPEDPQAPSTEMVLNEIRNTLGILHDRVEAVETRGESPDHLSTTFATSPQIEKLFTALAEASANFGEVKKTKTAKLKGKTRDGNSYDYEYKYADLADVVAATAKHLAAAGLVVTQPIIRSQNGVCVITMLVHKSGQWMRSNLTMPAGDAKPQTFGSASTYGRRYSLCAMLGVASEADDDGQAAQEAAPKAHPPEEPRAGSRRVTTPKGNGNGAGKKPPTEPKTRPKPSDGEESGAAQKVRDALADYRKASGDGDTNARVLLARALGKPWPEKPSEMDMTVAVAGFSTMADAAEKKTGDGEPEEYDAGDGKGLETGDGTEEQG